MQRRRSPQRVIDQAIRETRFWEALYFGLALLIVATGLAFFIVGVVRREPFVSLGGIVASTFFFPVFNATQRHRRQSLALRLLETAFVDVASTDDAKNLVKEFFATEFVKREKR